jgi:glyoxylase-like metal-dependent hydrolase (beta-lactamase superfamily II)
MIYALNPQPLLPMQAPNAIPIASGVEFSTYGSDQFLRPPLPLEDGQELDLGEFKVQYMWTPHTPHG